MQHRPELGLKLLSSTCIDVPTRLVCLFLPSLLQFAGVTVDRSFDVWSLGMAVLHLCIGQSYFKDSSDPQVSYRTSLCATNERSVSE